MVEVIIISLLGGVIGLLYGSLLDERERAERYRQWNDILCQQYRSLEEAYDEQARILAEMIADGDVLIDATDEPIDVWLN